MNETAWIFTALGSFGVGYAIAHFFKNMGKIYRKWGGLIAYFVFPIIIMFLYLSAVMIADFKNAFLSVIFAGAFIVRFMKRDG